MPEALLIIDYQNDFIPGGALAVTGGDEIADRINALAADPRFDLVVATRDWHPANHNSFAEQGGPWPAHCVQGTGGADFSPALEADRVDAVVDAGQKPELEGYSGFEETNLRDLLHERGIDKVTVVGLATDYCVKHTALDALREGFQVEIDSSAVRGVEVEPGDSDRALEEMRAAGANVT
ncbi:MAG: bifunctional nicotinamidase/pyrazinamidase [Thermoleophilaceae bacterium]|jgi:nicotinamidase/pyrazinamidase